MAASSPVPTRFASRLTAAALAIGRLAEAARRSPLAPAWQLREAAVVAGIFANRSLGPTRVEDLFAVVAGAPNACDTADEALHAALWLWRQGLAAWASRPLPVPWDGPGSDDFGDAERATGWTSTASSGLHPDVAEVLSRIGRADLVEVLLCVAKIRQEERCVEPLAIALPLALRPAVGATLPSLALGILVRPNRDAGAWVEACAAQLLRAAEAGAGRLVALERAWRRWGEALGPRRADSHLDATLRHLASMPLLTPGSVAAAARISAQAAAGHLRTLETAGVVEEVTGRARWRLYAAADLGLRPWEKGLRRRRGTDVEVEPGPLVLAARAPASPVDYAQYDRMLADAYQQIDAAMERVNERLRSAERQEPA